MFPGNLNGYKKDDPDYVDLYDCRRRVWYQIGSASPKDVVIILDTSGSMIGNNIAIAKVAAKSLIDTLEENDYFNVITVGKTSKFLQSCIPYLMQATRFNKERMKMAINKIEDPKDILDLSKAVTAAFQTLKSDVYYNRTYTAGCNKIIMVISDGIEGDYTSAAKDVFDEINPDKSVRVFSYLVGRVKNPDDRALKEMSCNNRGYFYKIETIGNVWDTVVEYLKVLSRPMAAQSVEVKPKISPIYLDSTGAGMVLTMSLGVFNKNDLSGVVGVDILIRALKQEIPVSELGYFSHAVIVNNNGFIILHPKFREQTGYLSALTNVYFEDLEYSANKNDSITLKKKMLNRTSGTMRFSTYWLYDNNHRIAVNNMTYFFNPINNTVLSSALAISDSDINYIVINKTIDNEIFMSGLTALYFNETDNVTSNATLPFSTYVQVAEWMYCNINSAMANLSSVDKIVYPTASEVYSYLSGQNLSTLNKVCKENLVKSLITTAGIAYKRLNESWSRWLCERVVENTDFLSLYVGTSGGYTRHFSINKTVPPVRDSLRISLFEQAEAIPDSKIIVSTPIRTTNVEELNYLNVKVASWIERNGTKTLVAVSGTEMHSGLIKRIFDNATASIGLDCMQNDTIVCAIIDQNGYIIVSNLGENAVGTFFGKVQGSLMEHLSSPNISIFQKIVLEDTQAECLEPKIYDSAGSILLTPLKLVFSLTAWLLSSTWHVFFHIIMLSSSMLQKHETSAQITIDPTNMSCTKVLTFFLFQNKKWEELLKRENISGNISERLVKCEPSKFQSFTLASVPGTNLIFIVAEPNDFSCRQKPLETAVNKDQELDFCIQDQRDREKPDKCFYQTQPYEESSEYCGADSALLPSFITFFPLTFYIIFHFKMLNI